jgi:hypothetical protein
MQFEATSSKNRKGKVGRMHQVTNLGRSPCQSHRLGLVRVTSGIFIVCMYEEKLSHASSED